jgi:hypothetical protein
MIETTEGPGMQQWEKGLRLKMATMSAEGKEIW